MNLQAEISPHNFNIYCYFTKETILQLLLSLQPYGSVDFETGYCRQHSFSILLR